MQPIRPAITRVPCCPPALLFGDWQRDISAFGRTVDNLVESAGCPTALPALPDNAFPSLALVVANKVLPPGAPLRGKAVRGY
jgi:hypothetical protein